MARTILWVYVFILCLSAGLWFFGEQLAIPAIADKSLPLDELADGYNSTVLGYEGGAGFNPVFLFGDYGKSITEFLNIIFGGYLYKMLLLFGFAQSFITGMVVITGFLVVGTLIYLVSGRQYNATLHPC